MVHFQGRKIKQCIPPLAYIKIGTTFKLGVQIEDNTAEATGNIKCSG
jgi:hypothetical protein